MGSVADKVVRGATIPVLVVPAVGRWVNLPKTILVPLDGSEASEGALALARTIGQALGATLVLLRAVDLYPMPVMEFGYWPVDLPQELEKTATGYLATLKAPGERVLAVPGEASIVIARVAAEVDADLVIMSASGKGLASRLVLGSTTDRVLHSLHRPLLIVPKAEERAVQDQDTKEGTR